MARIDISIPSLGNKFIDLRDTIPGDSFNFSWVRALSQVNYLAIHHTAGPERQTPEQIAAFHINSNGWGGIGYHFLINPEGVVFYAGDISTARANVANLNDQVIGICLIGNFTEGRVPTDAQFDSAHNLCDFFINNFPDLSNLISWDQVKGHKELPGQSTTCPGDNWPSWRSQIISGSSSSIPPVVPPTPAPLPSAPSDERGAKITEAYRQVLGRDPDMGGLQTYTNSPMSLEQIIWSMVTSEEHKNLLKAAEDANPLRDQISNMQTSLTSINQQVLILQESLQKKDEEINILRLQLGNVSGNSSTAPNKPDNTLTLTEIMINLFKFIFWPRSVGS